MNQRSISSDSATGLFAMEPSRRRFPEISHQASKRDLPPASSGESGGSPSSPALCTIRTHQGHEFVELPASEMTWGDAATLAGEACSGMSLSALPILQWLPKYSLSILQADLIAGLSVGVLLIPQSMAYSLLAGLPPIYGLYSGSIPLLVYALLASSTKVSPGPVAPTSILINGIIMSFATANSEPQELARLATGVAFATGVIQILMGLLRFGFIAQLLSWPVMSGYLAGAAVTIIASQLRDFFGVTYPPGTSDRLFYERLANFFTHLDTITWETTLISIACFIVLVGFKYLPACGLWPQCAVRNCGKKPPRWVPLQLIVVALCLLLALGMGLTSTGLEDGTQQVAVVGPIPASLPEPSLPFGSLSELIEILPQSFVLAVIAYVGTISLGMSFARKDNEEVSGNMELFASGAACLVGSFFGSFTVSGSFTRTAVNAEVGAKTPMAVFFTGSLMLVTLLFLSPLFETLPKAALAAMVMASTQSLMKPVEMMMFWRQRRVDAVQAILTFIFTLWLGIDWGIIAAVALAVALLVLRSFKPRITELGNLPSTSIFVDRARYPEAQLVPGVIVYRIDGELHFGNVKAVSTLLRKTLMAAVDAGAVPSSPERFEPTPGAATPARPAGEAGGHDDADADADAAEDSAERGADDTAPVSNGAIDFRFDRDDSQEQVGEAPSSPFRKAAAAASPRKSSGYKYRKANRRALPITTDGATQLADDEEDARAAMQGDDREVAEDGAVEVCDGDDAKEAAAAVGGVAGGVGATAAGGGVAGATKHAEAAALARLEAERAAMLASGVLKAVVLDGVRVSAIDLTACRDLRGVALEYSKYGVKLLLAAMPGPSRDVVEKFGVMLTAEEQRERDEASAEGYQPPPVKRYITVAAAVASVVHRGLWPQIKAGDACSRRQRVRNVEAVAEEAEEEEEEEPEAVAAATEGEEADGNNDDDDEEAEAADTEAAADAL